VVREYDTVTYSAAIYVTIYESIRIIKKERT
jgi:hypothetical protein